MPDHAEKLTALREPFAPADVEWRIQQAGMSINNNPWAMVIPYVTNRAIQQRLDDVFGLNWQNVQRQTSDSKGYLCGISVKVDDEWITRWDGAESTKIEPLKGALSGAMKRAGVQFGIGRYLYQMDEVFADCRACKNRRDAGGNYQWVRPGNKDSWKAFGMDWKDPTLPAWAMPHTDYTPFENAISSASTMDELRSTYIDAYKAAKTLGSSKLLKKFETLKDQSKERINEELALNLDNKLSEVQMWLNNEIKSFGLVSNLSSVNTIHTTIFNGLEKRCKDQLFDVDALRKQLGKAHETRTQQLQVKKDGK